VRRLALPFGLLAALLVWECWPASIDPVPSAVVIALPAVPARAETPPVAVWSDTVLARPLFAQTRRPAPGAGGGYEAPPRLAGTVRSNDSLLAIFAAAGAAPGATAKSLVVGPAGSVAGWTVAAIDDGVVTLERAGQSAVVYVSFAGAPTPPPPPPPGPKMVLLHEKRTSPFLQW
jgi:hypothetical protein